MGHLALKGTANEPEVTLAAKVDLAGGQKDFFALVVEEADCGHIGWSHLRPEDNADADRGQVGCKSSPSQARPASAVNHKVTVPARVGAAIRRDGRYRHGLVWLGTQNPL